MESLDLPEQVHRYRILSEIGRGSMGRVYLAEDPNIERRLALKVLSPRHLVDSDHGEELRERFLLEARAAGRLHHPGIATVYDADTDPKSGAPYLAMEYVDGPSLHQLLCGGQPLPVPEALDLIAQVAHALDYAHRQEVVHRDIKPANLLVHHPPSAKDPRTSKPVAKVVDFGIAKLVSAALTQPGYVVGTPNYMAPEQVRGQAVDGRADLFALGAVLYESLTGRTAFGSADIANVHYKILSVDPRPPEMQNPAITPAVRAVVDRALAKEPDERYQTGDEMAEALEAAASELAAEREEARHDRGEADSSATRRLPSVLAEPAPSSQMPVTDQTSLRDPRLPVAVGGESGSRWWYPVASVAFALLAVLAFLALVPEFAKVERQTEDPEVLEREPGPPWRTVPTASFSSVDAFPSSSPELRLPSESPPVPADLEDPKDPLAMLSTADEEDSKNKVPATAGENSSEETTSQLDGFADSPYADPPPENLPATPHLSAPPPLPKVRPSAPPHRPAVTTSLDILLRSSLRDAYLSAWIDGRKVLTERMRSGPFARLWGKEFRFSIQMPTGQHTLELHFSGMSRKLEAQKKIRHLLITGQPQVLRVRVKGKELHVHFEVPEP